MLFTSSVFLFVYLPLTLLGFFVVARLFGLLPAITTLVLASIVFYGYWDVRYVGLLVCSIAFNYCAGEWILQRRKISQAFARPALILAIAINLIVLAYYKYANFFIETLDDLSLAHLPRLDVALPLGISFFTFTQIAYLVDVYAGKVTERNAVRYSLFVTYFPHLIAGPVLHHADMMPQFSNPEIAHARLRNFVIGVTFLVVGLGKKILLADSVAPIANETFDQVGTHALTTLQAWEATLAYTLQIYFDFSGYSDMAVGLSMLFGVRLPYNFNSPYKAFSIIDFWRRWHMTLSRFLRDYLYIALGGNRKGTTRRYVNLLLTMLLGGLWHGAAWTFVIWGALHGLYLVVNHGWRWLKTEWSVLHRAVATRAGRAVHDVMARCLTLLAVMVAWVYFRAPSVADANDMLSCMLSRCAEPAATGQPSHIVELTALLLLALFAKNSQELIDGHLRAALERRVQPQHANLLAGMLGSHVVLIALLVFIAASRNVTEFIYFNF